MENKYFNMTEQKLTEILNKKKPLKFKDYTPKSIMDVIKEANTRKTFSDLRKKRAQCPEGRWRGFTDIYRLCHFYFPEVTVKELHNKLLKRGRSFCNETNQTVFYNFTATSYHSNEVIKINLKNGKLVELDIE